MFKPALQIQFAARSKKAIAEETETKTHEEVIDDTINTIKTATKEIGPWLLGGYAAVVAINTVSEVIVNISAK